MDRIPCLENSTTHSRLGLPTSINLINAISHIRTYKPTHSRKSFTEILFPGYDKVTIKANHSTVSVSLI